MYKDKNGKEFYLTTKREEVLSEADKLRVNIMARFQAAALLVIIVTICMILVTLVR